jgi:uncharacterized protein YajQ (UPF0234 family)
MNKIPRCKTKTIVVPQQPLYLKVNKKDILINANISRKISQKKLKFNPNNRQFGKDITISVKNNKKEESQKVASSIIKTNKVIQINL